MRRFLPAFQRPSPPPRPERVRLPIFATPIAVAVGLLVLVDLLTPWPLLDNIGAVLVEYALIIAVFALLLGVLNVFIVHSRRVQHREAGWPYSLLLLVVALFLIVAGLITGPTGFIANWSLLYILLPLQAAFFSLLAFFLLSVAYRHLRVRSVESALFVASATIVILGNTPLSNLSPLLLDVKSYLIASLAASGARGLLLGVALGTIITGLRLIFDGPRYFK